MKDKLRELPSVDEVLKSSEGKGWLASYPRAYVLEAVRRAIDARRKALSKGLDADISTSAMVPEITDTLLELSALSLRPVINATGIVVHTNLGRSALPERALENIISVARGYSNLEYDLGTGRRGKRYSHIKRLLGEVTGASDGIAVNNNAAAVLLCLSALASGREVIVSRGEMVEIGGSFRVPDVMAQSGAVLREVGATNKTHLRDYRAALSENTALILKVHQSNYRITGFTQDCSLTELVGLGREFEVPVMYDLGSGSIADLRGAGISTEPTVREVVAMGPDLVTFSGDKLLGGPQAGIIVGTGEALGRLMGHPLLRAIRIDKLTLAALEAVLMEYVDPEAAINNVPTLRMLFEEPESVKRRARKLAGLIAKSGAAETQIVAGKTFAGGGSLPELELDTYCVALDVKGVSEGELEARFRLGEPAIIGRIHEGVFLLDMRTVAEEELKTLAECVERAASG